MPTFLNLVEPESLVRAFLAFPPEAFEAFISPDGVPAFTTRFDLLTTLDNAVRRRIMGLPLYRYWCHLLRARTLFIGTTVSEYVLFPKQHAPVQFVRTLMDQYAHEYPFIVIKDVPQASPLLDATCNEYADKITEACQSAGFTVLEGQALAYVPIDFESIEAYIARLSSGRRRDIRRKLRSREIVAIEAVRCGSEYFQYPTVLEQYYALYLNVFHQSEVHFDLLRVELFQQFLRDASNGGIVFEYRYCGKLVGYNVCFASANMLIDKYVGFCYPDARNLNLYFISWFHNLAYALENGLSYYVAGWTDPEIKAYLGAQFTVTRHAVYARNRVPRFFLRRLAHLFESDRIALESQPNDHSHRP